MLTEDEIKPLHPLDSGVVLIVGGKPSNFGDEIKNNPRVIMWNSQDEHWVGKSIPTNTRAIFVTKWIGHQNFANILKEARKRNITMFNPEGTGRIIRQVKELLSLSVQPTVYGSLTSLTQLPERKEPTMTYGPRYQAKLPALIPFIDFSKGNLENAKILLHRAEELHITTTLHSLANFVGVQRKKATGSGLRDTHPIKKGSPVPQRAHKYVDVAVEILDNMVKELQDMRDYLVATTEENRILKSRIENFKKALNG